MNIKAAAFAAVAITSCSAQDLSRHSGIKNAQHITVKVDGDCPMCEKTIESVGSVKGEAIVDWDVDAKTASITWDTTRTDLDAILERIAHAGYDNERYLAPQQAYEALPSCCQYERTLKHEPVKAGETHAGHQHGEDHDGPPSVMDKPGYRGTPQTDAPDEQRLEELAEVDHLEPLFDAYFKLKDALVASDPGAASGAATTLTKAIEGVPMADLDHEVHMVWMKVLDPLKKHANVISTSTDLEKQRIAFKDLSRSMIELARAADHEGAIHLQHCPMYEGGSYWLSREKEIRNPYYGSKMLTCGSVKETIE